MRSSFIIGSAPFLSATMGFAETTELMVCAIQDSSKMVTVTLDGADVVYGYGNLNATPKQILTTPAADIDYQPWPGVSNTIWETFTFYNGDYAYTVFMGVERADDPFKYGGITVQKAGVEIANLDCIGASVSFDAVSPLPAIKREAGWCLDRGAKGGWSRCD